MKRKKLNLCLFLSGLLLTSCSFESIFGSNNGGASNGEETSNINQTDENFRFVGEKVFPKDKSISGDLEIPSEFNGIKITTIPESAFSSCTAITSIKIPNTVTFIGDGAFSGCIRMESITLPFSGNSRDKMQGGGHFGRIFGTTSYTGGTKVSQAYYKESGFDAGEKNSTYYIPSGLKSVTLTDATQLGYGAFQNMSMLTDIHVNYDLVAVGKKAFNNCTSLREASLPKIYGISNQCFSNCASLESFYIGPNVTTIGENAFEKCTRLSSINSQTEGDFVVPNSVTEIENGAFSGCIRAKNITLPFCGNSKDKTQAGGRFGRIFGTANYAGTTKVYQSYYSDSGFSSGEYGDTFYVPANLEKVTLTDAIQLGYGAFQNMTMLKELYINIGAKDAIGTNALNNCVTPIFYSSVRISDDIEGTISLNNSYSEKYVSYNVKEEHINEFSNSGCANVYVSIYFDSYGLKNNIFENWGNSDFAFYSKDSTILHSSNNVHVQHNDKFRTDEYYHKMKTAEFINLSKISLHFWYDNRVEIGGNYSGNDYTFKNIKIVLTAE